MEYSIHDAIRAGFTKIVFIIKNDMQGPDAQPLRRPDRRADGPGRGAGGGMLRRAGLFQSAGLLYRARRAYQALRHHPRRAVRPALCAGAFLRHQRRRLLRRGRLPAIYEELGRLPQQGKATMVGYLLRNTVSAHGTVSRGVCQVENGHLAGIHGA